MRIATKSEGALKYLGKEWGKRAIMDDTDTPKLRRLREEDIGLKQIELHRKAPSQNSNITIRFTF